LPWNLDCLSVLTKAKTASKIQLVATLLSKGIGAIFTIWLARILFPADYGYLTIAILVTGFLTIFSNFGFQSFLLQNDNTDIKVSHTTFFLEIIFSLGVAGLIIGGSFLAEHHYSNDTIAVMLRLYSLNIFIDTLGHTPVALLKKELDFGASSKGEIAYAITSHSARVLFALNGFGAISFPLGDIVGSVLKTVIIYYYSTFRPRTSMFARAYVSPILSFGGYTSITSVASYFANQTDKLLITSFYPVSSIGLYNFGYGQSGMFYNLVLASQVSVFQSMFARLKNDLKQAREAIYKITRFINFLCLPFYTYAIIEAKLIIGIVFTEKWLPAAFYFQVFAADFMIRTFFASVTAIQISFGLAKQAAKTKIITSIVFVAMLLIAILFNTLEYYALAYLAASIVSALINLYVNGSVVQLNFKTYWLNFLPNILTIAITIILYVSIDRLLGFSNNFLGLTASFAAFGGIYFLLSLRFNGGPAFQFVRMIKEYKT
jgi:O-antigen/teichoic acid export membrane protein